MRGPEQCAGFAYDLTGRASESAAEEEEGPSSRRHPLASQDSSVARVPALGGSAPGNGQAEVVCRVGVLLALGASQCPAAEYGLADSLAQAGFLKIQQRWLQNGKAFSKYRHLF